MTTHRQTAINVARQINQTYKNIFAPWLNDPKARSFYESPHRTDLDLDLCIDEEEGWLVSFHINTHSVYAAHQMMSGVINHLQSQYPDFDVDGWCVNNICFVRVSFTSKARNYVKKEKSAVVPSLLGTRDNRHH